MSDLIEKLRFCQQEIADEAAAKLSRIEAENAELKSDREKFQQLIIDYGKLSQAVVELRAKLKQYEDAPVVAWQHKEFQDVILTECGRLIAPFNTGLYDELIAKPAAQTKGE